MARSLRQGLCTTHAAPPHEKTKSKGWPGSPLEPSEGHLNWLLGLPALMGGNLGWCIFQFPLIFHSLWGVPYAGYIKALRSFSVLDILLPPPPFIVIMQDCSQASYRLHFIVIKIYGVVFIQLAHTSLGDWKDISIAHVIIIIKSEVSTLPIA